MFRQALKCGQRRLDLLKPHLGNRYVPMMIRIRNVGHDAYRPSGEFQAVSSAG